MIDVIDRAPPIAQFNQDLEGIDNVRALAVLRHQLLRGLIAPGAEVDVIVKDAGSFLTLPGQATVELHTPDRREIVAVEGEEQVME